MEIKMTFRFHLSLVRMIIIKKYKQLVVGGPWERVGSGVGVNMSEVHFIYILYIYA
jgi:hypothetical protein